MPCMTPFNVVVKSSATEQEHTIGVPCGRCPDCVGKRVSHWSFRLMQEAKRSTSAIFLTLTYNEKNLPLTELGLMTLKKHDLTCFLKRLRELNWLDYKKAKGKIPKPPTIKYYAVGEYGTKHKRPHYHLILFNAKMDDIELAWRYGTKYYGDVQGPSIGYCLKYLSKEQTIGVHPNDDRQPEYAVMSKGIGNNYLTPQMVQWHLKDIRNRLHVNVGDRKVTMPRYYKDKIFTDQYFPSVEEAKLVRQEAAQYLLQKQEQLLSQEIIRKGEKYQHNKVQSDLSRWAIMNLNGQHDTTIF